MAPAHRAPSLSQPSCHPQLSLLVTAQPPHMGTGAGDTAESPRCDGDGRLQAVPAGTQRAQVVKSALLWRPDLGAGCCVSPSSFRASITQPGRHLHTPHRPLRSRRQPLGPPEQDVTWFPLPEQHEAATETAPR